MENLQGKFLNKFEENAGEIACGFFFYIHRTFVLYFDIETNESL